MISSSLESLSEEVKTRASNEHVAELQKVLGRMRHLQEHGGANVRSAEASSFVPNTCLACNQALPLNLDMNLSFVRMVPLERITAKGRVVKAGRKVAFLEGELFDGEGRLLARATSTAIPTPMPGASPANGD